MFAASPLSVIHANRSRVGMHRPAHFGGLHFVWDFPGHQEVAGVVAHTATVARMTGLHPLLCGVDHDFPEPLLRVLNRYRLHFPSSFLSASLSTVSASGSRRSSTQRRRNGISAAVRAALSSQPIMRPPL